jgi:hypothetical protein
MQKKGENEKGGKKAIIKELHNLKNISLKSVL